MKLKRSNGGHGSGLGGVVGVGIIKLKLSNGSWEGYGRVEALRFQKRVIKPIIKLRNAICSAFIML